MNLTVTLDWKSILALGVSFFIVRCAITMGNEELENVLIHAIDSFSQSNTADFPAVGAF